MSLELAERVPGEAATGPEWATQSRRVPLLRGLRRDRTALVGLVVVVFFGLMALAGPWVAPHDPDQVDIVHKFEPPSREFLLGTDHLGRDVLSRILHGARLSLLTVVVAAVAISTIGIVLGMLAGYLGGLVDTVVSRVVDGLQAFPPFLLALALTGVWGPSLRNVTLAIVSVWWAGYARIVRASVLAERAKLYVESARAVGAAPLRLLGRHVLPNIVGPILILTTLDMGSLLLGISSLSFLGLGVKPPTAEWGSMLSEARAYLSQAPHGMFYPGAAIFLTVLGFNLLGDGLRDVLDPRLGRGEGARPPAK